MKIYLRVVKGSGKYRPELHLIIDPRTETKTLSKRQTQIVEQWLGKDDTLDKVVATTVGGGYDYKLSYNDNKCLQLTLIK